jgi:hypothetical protein
MSQVEGFNDNDKDTVVTRPLMPTASPPKGAGDSAAIEDGGAQSPALAVNPRGTRWPRWPTAWPDGPLRSR